jgi:transposase
MIELVRAGRHPEQLSREFGCTAQSIRNWVAQDAVDRGKPPRGKVDALTSVEREELARLRRQVKHLQMERDILAKATAWFAGRNGSSSNS